MDRTVARVNGQPITLSQLQAPLIEGYGLNVLLNLVQLELAKQQVAKAGQTVTPAEIDAEMARTQEKMFANARKEDYAALMEQFLAQQHITRAEFDLVVQTNAYLRKLAEPMLAGKINDDSLKAAFGAFYGENVSVRNIRLSNMQEVAEAKRRLSAGEAFEDVARAMSRDARTAPLGGAIPPFARQSPGLPDAFKDMAFSLKPGEVSDPVLADGAYHLIKLEEKIAPKAVKFEDVRESVRKELEERWIQQAVKDIRQNLSATVLQTLEINEPVLQKQFADRMNKQQAAIRDQEEIRKRLEQQRNEVRRQQGLPEEPISTTEPTTLPAVLPVLPPTTAPSP